MAQALTAFFIFMIVAGGIMVTLNRRTRNRMKEVAFGDEPSEPVAPPPRNLSRRQQRIVSTLEPDKELPSIQDLVEAEAADTGVNDIPGGDGLDVSLKLRVFWRDEVVRRGCDDGQLEFRIDGGVSPDEAETEDVRLVCVRNGVVVETPAADPGPAQASPASEVAETETGAEDAPGADAGLDGNFEAGLDVD